MTTTRTPGIGGKSFIGSLSPRRRLRLCPAWGWGFGRQRATPLPAVATCPRMPWVPQAPGKHRAGGSPRLGFRAGWDPCAQLHPLHPALPPPQGAARGCDRGHAGCNPPPARASPAMLGTEPALHSCGVGLCRALWPRWGGSVGGTVQQWAGMLAPGGDGGSAGLFSACPGEDEGSISPSPGRTVASDPGAADREERIAERARVVLPLGGGGGVSSPSQPPGSGVQVGGGGGAPVPTPLHPCGWQCHGEGLALHMGIGWELPQGRDGGGHRLSAAVPPPPLHLHPSYTNTPPPRRTRDRHHLAEFNWGSPSYKSHPTAHDTHPPSPKQHTEGGGRAGDPPIHPHSNTEAQQKHTARPWLRFSGRHRGAGGGPGRAGAGRGRSRGLGAPAKMLQGKAPESPPGGREDPKPPPPASPKAVGRQWGRGCAGWGGGAAGCSLTGAKLGPAAPTLPRVLRGRGDLHPATVGLGRGVGDTSRRWQKGHGGTKGLCIGCIPPGAPCTKGG